MRATPSYSPTPMPNSTEARWAFHRASGGNRKNMARPPAREALCSLIVLYEWEAEGNGNDGCAGRPDALGVHPHHGDCKAPPRHLPRRGVRTQKVEVNA